MHRGDSAEVFHHVLLADESDWDYQASRKRDRGAKDIFEHEDALGMVSEGPMPEVSRISLATVERAGGHPRMPGVRRPVFRPSCRHRIGG